MNWSASIGQKMQISYHNSKNRETINTRHFPMNLVTKTLCVFIIYMIAAIKMMTVIMPTRSFIQNCKFVNLMSVAPIITVFSLTKMRRKRNNVMILSAV